MSRYNETGGRAGRVLAPSNRGGRKVRTPLCVSREIPSSFFGLEGNPSGFGLRVKGNAPGNARGRGREWRAKACHYNRVTESATENKPPRKIAAVTGGRKTCSSSFKGAFAGKGETVG